MAKVPEPMTEAYLALTGRLPLRPIRDEPGLDRAIAMLDELLDREALAPEEDDYLDDLGNLVYEYELVHWPMPCEVEERRGLSTAYGRSGGIEGATPVRADASNS